MDPQRAHDVAPSVYPPREDTALLLPFARGASGRRLLEIGVGSGAIAVAAARAGARVIATDLNPRALRATATAARAEGVSVGLVRTDLALGLRRFDRIVCNPPYLPTPPAARDPDRWANLALDGGPDGLATARRLLAALLDHLAPEGLAYVLFSSRQSAEGRAQLATEWTRRVGTRRTVATARVGDETLEVWELGVGHRTG